MNKKLIILGILFLAITLFGKLIYFTLHNIQLDDFHKASVIFILDTSSANQNMLKQEEMYIKSLCAILDPEDSVKILKTDESSYLIFEGTPAETSSMQKAFDKFTKTASDKTSYGEAIKKSIELSLTMKKNGYTTSVVVVGGLENNGDAAKQINWETLPENINKAKEYIPELTMMFVYAHPQKLDMVKTKLNPILGENKLILANSAIV